MGCHPPVTRRNLALLVQIFFYDQWQAKFFLDSIRKNLRKLNPTAEKDVRREVAVIAVA